MPVPNDLQLHFDENRPPIRCDGLEQLDLELDRLHRNVNPNEPPLAVAIPVFGHEIDLGLGADPTFVCIQIDPCDGEFYLPVGDGAEGESVMFYGAGQDSYWSPRNLIPLETARSVVRHFVEHQQRSGLVRWQDWDGRDV